MKAHDPEMCEACSEKWNGRPPCGTCEHAEPLLSRLECAAKWFSDHYGFAFCDSLGGMNIRAIDSIIEAEAPGLTARERLLIMRKIVRFSAAMAAKKETSNVL